MTAVALLFPCETARAQEPVVGEVVALRGAVFQEAGGSMRPLTANASIHAQDAIVAAEGKARIALDDGTVISVGEHTRVRIAQYRHSQNAVSARLELLSGALRLFTKKVAPRGSFEVETETAIAAVRGTDWLIESTPARTSVALLRGVVTVNSRSSATAAVVLRQPGSGTDVARNAAPTAPAPWGAGRLADLLARATFD